MSLSTDSSRFVGQRELSVAAERAWIIGMGEVGRRIADALADDGLEVVPVTRATSLEPAAGDQQGLRVVCVREDDLPGVLEALDGVPAREFVTVQNGWVRDLVPPGSTRALIWFTSKGDFFRPLRPTPVTGPAAHRIATALSRSDIPARAVDPSEFDPLDADKMGFNCVVGLPLAVHGVSLGEYLEHHSHEAEQVFSEALNICCRALHCSPPDNAWRNFQSSVEPLGWVRTGTAKALRWRNGAVVRLADELGLDAPHNRRLLAAVATG